MCGRFSLFQVSELSRRFGVELKPRYNISPTQDSAVIIDDKLELLPWGIKLKQANLINTRVETWGEKPFFGKMQRVLIPADGFYEWKSGNPFRIEAGKVFSFAGLLHEKRFSIITMPPDAFMAGIHNRMPAILSDEKAWLDDGKIVSHEKLSAYEVSKLVNNPRNDVQEVIARI
jgi:putative SOS response-associated peptidase YedK